MVKSDTSIGKKYCDAFVIIIDNSAKYVRMTGGKRDSGLKQIF